MPPEVDDGSRIDLLLDPVAGRSRVEAFLAASTLPATTASAMAICFSAPTRARSALMTPMLTSSAVSFLPPLHHETETLSKQVLGLEHLVQEPLIGGPVHAFGSAWGPGLEPRLATKPHLDLVGSAQRPLEAVLTLGSVDRP